jgi:hypothetical protein
MNERVNIEAKEGVSEIHLLEGRAAEIRQPEGYCIETTLAGVIDYYSKRKDRIGEHMIEGGLRVNNSGDKRITKDNSYLLVNRNKGSVELVIGDLIKKEAITIKGNMIPNPDYYKLGINGTTYHTERDLEMILRRMPHLFPQDSDAYSKTLEALRNFTVKVTGEVKKADNQRGNVSNSSTLSATFDSNMFEELNLIISPWTNPNPPMHKVKVLVRVDGDGVRFFLESKELMLTEVAEKNAEIQKVIDALTELPIMEVA